MDGKANEPDPADIELTAKVRMRTLRFREQPDTSVGFTGDPGHEAASGSDRTNLPERVEAGVTYRDVSVDYRLAARIAGLDASLSER